MPGGAGGTDNIAIVVIVDSNSNQALVVDSAGNTNIVPARDVATNGQVSNGQVVKITPEGNLTSAGISGGQAADQTPSVMDNQQGGSQGAPAGGVPGGTVSEVIAGVPEGVPGSTSGGQQGGADIGIS